MAVGNIVGDTKVWELVQAKRPIISVPDVASVRTALQVMLANDLVALPVSAPPGKYLGAGASFIVDRDKQYIAVVSMVDVAMHLAALRCAAGALNEPVLNVIGSSPEGLSMWVYQYSTCLSDIMEPLSKGVHRVLIKSKGDTQGPSPAGVPGAMPAGDNPAPSSPVPVGPEAEGGGDQGVASSPAHSSDYCFLSQTDVVAFLAARMDELGQVAQRSLSELSLVDPLFPPLAVSESVSVLGALRLMHKAQGIRAVAVVEDDQPQPSMSAAAAAADVAGADVSEPMSAMSLSGSTEATISGGDLEEQAEGTAGAVEAMRRQDLEEVQWRRGGKLKGTLSVTDLRGLDEERLKELGKLKVGQFLSQMQSGGASRAARVPVACRPESPLSLCMSLAVANHVHRVWVTTDEDLLVGVVSLSDILAAVRRGMEASRN